MRDADSRRAQDFMSLPQKPRTLDEAATFGRALSHMGVLYAHPATAVVQVKDVPERPLAFDGCVIAFTNDLQGSIGVEQELRPQTEVGAEAIQGKGRAD